MSLPEGWVESTLGEIAVKITKGSTPTKKEGGFTTSGINFIKAESITDEGKYIQSKFVYIPSEIHAKYKRSQLKENDILFSIAGVLGRVSFVTKDILPANTNQALALIRINNNTLPLFIFYYLKQRDIHYYVNNSTSQSAQPNINLEQLGNLEIILPPLQEQKAIANILSSFDEKIELLKAQNETLEQMAQGVFREWFVKFNYPNATGKMIESELGEIPEGWRIFKLSDLVETVNGYSYKGKELVESSDEALVTLKSFNRNGGFQTRGFKPFIGTPKESQEVQIGDLVVAHTDLTQDAEVLGNPAFIFEDGGYNKMYITMDLVKVNSKIEHIDNAFLYYVMKDRRFKGHCVGYANGTTVLHLSKKAIPEYEMALPEDLRLANEFSDIAYTMTRKISNNINQIQTLQKTRDTLLPKLMSGDVRVKGFGA